MASGLLRVSSVYTSSSISVPRRANRPTSLNILSSSPVSTPPSFLTAPTRRREGHGLRRRGPPSFSLITSALRKLSEAEHIAVTTEELEEVSGGGGRFPEGPGVFGIYDEGRQLQFIGITRNISASVAVHRKSVPDLCRFVKVGLIEEPEVTQATLTNAWKSWMEEHLVETGKVPPGNETGNSTWVRRPPQKPDIQLTPGRHVKLAVPIEELLDCLVKETEVVAFIKGSRSAPSCGFSQRVVSILEAQRVDFECVDVLDEEHNHGLREALKIYSKWPTFPQVFVKGELIGGCDIISAMAEKGELSLLFQK